MPLATIASAWARTVGSSILPAKWFQLFQPIGGVGAALAGAARAAPPANPRLAAISAAAPSGAKRRGLPDITEFPPDDLPRSIAISAAARLSFERGTSALSSPEDLLAQGQPLAALAAYDAALA